MRDPALLPGPTAQQWDGRSRIALGAAISVIPLALLGAALGVPASPGYLLVCSALFVAGFAVWIVLGQFSLAKLRAEMDAGYSTMMDIEGFALRHPITGALERSAEVPPLNPGPIRRSFALDAFRVRIDNERTENDRTENDRDDK